MQTISEVQKYILDELGIKTSVSKGKGSMKGYICIRVILQDGIYPKIPFQFAQDLKVKLSHFSTALHPVFSTNDYIDIYGITDDRIQFKKERKVKVSDESPKGWGSKNSQMRLDKATARYAKNLAKGNCARYY